MINLSQAILRFLYRSTRNCIEGRHRPSYKGEVSTSTFSLHFSLTLIYAIYPHPSALKMDGLDTMKSLFFLKIQVSIQRLLEGNARNTKINSFTGEFLLPLLPMSISIAERLLWIVFAVIMNTRILKTNVSSESVVQQRIRFAIWTKSSILLVIILSLIYHSMIYG